MRGKLVELSRVVQERVKKILPQVDDRRPYIALEHLSSGGTQELDVAIASEAVSAKTVFEAGDSLFGKLRPKLRKCVRVSFQGVCSTDILVLAPKREISSEFLPHLLRSEKVMAFAIRSSVGTKMPRTSWDLLSSCSVLIPSAKEQSRITTLLDTFDGLTQSTRQIAQQSHRLKSALAQDLLANTPTTKRFPTRTAKLGDLFTERTERGRPGLPTIAVTMHDGIMDREDMDRRIESALTPEDHLLARKGDIAYNMMRMWQGVSGLVPQDSLVSPAYVVVTPKADIDPAFAAHFFKLPETIRLFRRYSQGLTADRLRLYYQHFSQIPVTIPQRLKDQKRIAALLETLDQNTTAQEATLARLTRTKTAISNTIFAQP